MTDCGNFCDTAYSSEGHWKSQAAQQELARTDDGIGETSCMDSMDMMLYHYKTYYI